MENFHILILYALLNSLAQEEGFRVGSIVIYKFDNRRQYEPLQWEIELFSIELGGRKDQGEEEQGNSSSP